MLAFPPVGTTLSRADYHAGRSTPGTERGHGDPGPLCWIGAGSYLRPAGGGAALLPQTPVSDGGDSLQFYWRSGGASAAGRGPDPLFFSGPIGCGRGGGEQLFGAGRLYLMPLGYCINHPFANPSCWQRTV